MPELYARCFDLGSPSKDDLKTRFLQTLEKRVAARWSSSESWFKPGQPRRFLARSATDSTGRYIVGHVGRHLDTPKTR